MKKIYLVVGLLIFVVGAYFLYQIFFVTEMQKFNNLPQPDVDISCTEDSDCKLIELYSPCGGNFHSVNKKADLAKIEKYNNEAEELLKGYEFDCISPLGIDNFEAVCSEMVCDYVTK